ncbi:MAG TPA: NAD-dependent epimerase [Bdellovibrionales bacterium]|mgnify:CR=1 FL=1|nr:NAD-dependent epimerase [Pseudobdellovibrionaceae bacterium]HAG91344.1 NAD-dependent epimerase [Bdellovibrionales bacterium]|tara:strand:+ start:2438 stop:3334 length:897 start_codon:yes stop_codon:yes gene_type:complete
MQKFRILVTGGSGFLGSHIADALSDEGHDVTLFDVKPSPFLRSDQKMVVGDLKDKESVDQACQDIDYVYHLGAIADIDVCKDLPYETMEVNILGTINLLDSCVRHKVKRMMFSSSIYVHSRSGSFYRISKHACEQIIEEYHLKYNLPYTILRFGTLYGTRSDEHNSVYRYLKSALNERKILFKGKGDEVREYIHVQDSAQICVKILESEFEGKNLIITGHHRMKVTELLSMIQEILGSDVDLIHDETQNVSHYSQTPFSYMPKTGKKMVMNQYCDLGQSLVEILEEINGEGESSIHDQ